MTTLLTRLDAPQSLPATVRDYVAGFDACLKRRRALHALGWATVFALSWATASCLLDRAVALPAGARLVMLLMNAAGAVAIVARPMFELLRRRVDWTQSAELVEARDPTLAQRLETLVSRVLGPVEYRGSTQMLTRLADDLSVELSGRDPATLVPARQAVQPWWIVLAIGVIGALLWPVDYFNLPALAQRYVMPTSDVRPVTTTRLTVQPGDIDLVEGRPLLVRVTARRLGDNPVNLHVRRQHRDWMVMNMSSAPGGAFEWSLGEIDQDLEYYVTAGDATSDGHEVRVLRRPIVTEFRITYSYPQYTGLASRMATSADGLVEGPPGTRVTLGIVSSEALSASTITLGDELIPMTPTDDPHVRQATFTIGRDMSYEVGLSSARGVVGAGPGGLYVRVIPDRAPSVRFILPTEDLWLAPRDVLWLCYDASDDYGLAGLELHVRVGAQSDAERARDFAIPLDREPRRQVGEYRLDLGALELSAGDVVTLRLRAEDRPGQWVMSDPLRVIVSPRSISANTKLTLLALRRAQTLCGEVDESHKVVQVAPQIRRALHRAIYHSDWPELTRIMPAMVDRLTVIEMTARTRPDESILEQVRSLEQEISQARTALKSRVLLYQLENLSAADESDELIRRPVERLRADVTESLRQLRLTASPALRDRVTQMHESAVARLRERQLLDPAQLCASWTEANTDAMFLAERLLSAAECEALRSDADALWAHDLEVASRAVRRIETMNDPATAHMSAMKLVWAIEDLQTERQLRRVSEAFTPTEARAIQQRASASRQWFWQHAHDAEPVLARRALASALRANAEAMRGRYEQADQIDREMGARDLQASSSDSLYGSWERRRATALARSIDALVARQEQLLRTTQARRIVVGVGRAEDLAQQQAALVRSIARLSLGNEEAEHPRVQAAVAITDVLLNLDEEQRRDTEALRRFLPETSSSARLPESEEFVSVERLAAELAWARHVMLRDDALASAWWHAREAMEHLRRGGTDYAASIESQQMALEALHRARGESLGRAGAARLIQVPALQPIISPFAAREELIAARRRPGARAPAPTRRTEPDPPGFDEALRAYFDAIGHPRTGRRR